MTIDSVLKVSLCAYKLCRLMQNAMDFQTSLAKVVRFMDVDDLKPKQIEAIKSFKSGKDTFVSLPTGYGKSIIFAVLPLLFDYMHGKPSIDYSIHYKYYCTFCLCITGSIAVVVTPLISLMLDQKNKFLQKGNDVEFVGEAQEDKKTIEKIINGQVQLVYISPENLLENRHYQTCYGLQFIKKR